MQLRNRKTGEKFDTNGDKIKSTLNLFNPPSYLTKVRVLLNQAKDLPEQFYNYVEKTLYQMDEQQIGDQEKIKRSEQFVNACLENKEYISKLVEHHSEDLKQLVELDIQDKSSGPYKPHSFVVDLFTKLGLGAISNYSPVAAIIAGLFIAPAAATSPVIKVNSGIPTGGADLCGSLNLYCRQGYLTNAESNDLIAQFLVNLNAVVYGNKQGIPLPMLDCLSVGKVGQSLSKLFPDAISNGTEICTANSIPHGGYTATVQCTDLTESACQIIQQKLNPLFTECMNKSNQINLIVGISIAGAIAAIGIAAGIAVTAAATHCCTKNPCSND